MSIFAGQCFLLTGSSSGMGLATAKVLLEEGAQVALHGLQPLADLPPEAHAVLQDNKTHYIQADLTNPGATEELAKDAIQWAGQLHGFVHCAAMTSHREWSEVAIHEWDSVYKVNVRAAFLLTQRLAPSLKETSGSIVLVSSTHAVRVNHRNLLYDTSKAALNHLGRSLALELKADSIRVNTVMPGGVNTPMLRNWLVDYTGSEREAGQVLNEGIRSGRIGQPQDIAKVITFLLSPNSRWITGATITADGGALLER